MNINIDINKKVWNSVEDLKMNLAIKFYLGMFLLSPIRNTLNTNILMKFYKEYEY